MTALGQFIYCKLGRKPAYAWITLNLVSDHGQSRGLSIQVLAKKTTVMGNRCTVVRMCMTMFSVPWSSSLECLELAKVGLSKA